MTSRKSFRILLSLLVLLLLNGCSDGLMFTTDNSYSVRITTADNNVQKFPLQLSWNSNAAVMKKMLLEASFVLGDLHSLADESEAEKKEKPDKPGLESSKPNPDSTTVLLEVNFPTAKSFSLTVDNKAVIFDISSAQIEVSGKHPGRVVLNQSITLQGIPNPNLQPAFEELMSMINKRSLPQNKPN